MVESKWNCSDRGSDDIEDGRVEKVEGLQQRFAVERNSRRMCGTEKDAVVAELLIAINEH